ncbi:hypothetical protein PHISP_03691 [Aspergillus sp. HF37]|nr:hypothetical protein PHISP_03691 [Aspergillus sp. HF37]
MTQPPQTFQIHYFAAASSYTQRETESLPAPTTLSRLFPILEDKYPGIRERVLSSCSVALGGEYVDVDLDSGEGEGEGKDTVIAPGDEVAIIPPVSSG